MPAAELVNGIKVKNKGLNTMKEIKNKFEITINNVDDCLEKINIGEL